MPAEVPARFLPEAVIQVIGYFTARLLLPLVTFGHVRVDPLTRGTPPKFKWHGVHRTRSGKIVLQADLAGTLGLIFWAAIIASGAVIYIYM